MNYKNSEEPKGTWINEEVLKHRKLICPQIADVLLKDHILQPTPPVVCDCNHKSCPCYV
jgi:hypothetical protein